MYMKAPQDELDRLVDTLAADPSRAEAVKLALRARLVQPHQPVRSRVEHDVEDMWDNVPV